VDNRKVGLEAAIL